MKGIPLIDRIQTDSHDPMYPQELAVSQPWTVSKVERKERELTLRDKEMEIGTHKVKVPGVQSPRLKR